LKTTRTTFFVISFKDKIIPIIFLIFTVSLIIFARQTLHAAKSGLDLWATAVVPSLFPFLVATELLGKTNIIYSIGKILNRFMKPIFNVPGIGSFAFLMGLISGYPIGAKIIADLRTKNLVTKSEAERLLSFCNNSGPLFIIATVGIIQFCDIRAGILLFITHLLASISVGIIFRFWKFNDKEKNTKINHMPYIKNEPLGEMLSDSISKAIQNILMVGGFVVLFSVVISILKEVGANSPFIIGLLEITNGIKETATFHAVSINTAIISSAFLLGFGGISIMLQSFSIISKTDISIKPYVIGKFFQGCFASLYTFLIFKNTNFFNLDAVTTFNSSVIRLNRTYMYATGYYNYYANYSFILVFILLIIGFTYYRKLFK